MFVQMHLFNDADYTNQFLFYIKWKQVETERGVSGGEGEREREKQIKGVRDRA